MEERQIVAEECLLSSAVRRSLELLQRSACYAADARCSPWDLAVEMERLLNLGLDKSELRWLLAKGFVDSAREVPAAEPGERCFADHGFRTLTPQSCFVLTEVGVDQLHELHRAGVPLSLVELVEDAPPEPAGIGLPKWNQARRTLTLDGRIVKHYRVPAENQELILSAFEEEGWPLRIDDPLAPIGQHDPKRRLQSAIMCLNRNRRHPLLRFRGDGTGTGILWETSCA